MHKNLQCLIIDEADRLLDIGFEQDMQKIVRILPRKRQTMLFSATSNKKTEDLIKLSLKKEPIYVGIEEQNNKVIDYALYHVLENYIFCIGFPFKFKKKRSGGVQNCKGKKGKIKRICHQAYTIFDR